MSTEVQKMPKVESLIYSIEQAKSKLDRNLLNQILNQNPPQKWIHKNKFADNTPYIPIAIVEFILTSIFGQWRVEIKETSVIANSVTVTVRLWYKDPITGDWEWTDGIGASPIQVDKDAHASDISKIKKSGVQMAAPAAKTYAIKDAAETLGRIFGKDISRKEEHTVEISADLEKRQVHLQEKLKQLQNV